MVTRRNTGKADEHAGNGEETSETTPETDNPVLQRILQRMDQLQEQNQALQEQNQTLQTQVTTLTKGRTDEEIPEGDTGEFHPFSMEIAESPLDFREPPLKDYDGTTDPQAHVTIFKTQMLKRGLGDAIQCKLFSGTLSGAALIWFSHLPPLSISGIQDLLKKFLAQFSARRSRMMTSGKLFSIRQRADEPLQRSNNEGSSTQKTGKEQGQAFQQHARTKKGYDSRGRNFQSRTSWDDRQRSDLAGGYGIDTLTPLNTSRARILKEVYQSDLIRLPPQAEGPRGPDLNKWCNYHRAHGHDTENCWTLMNMIERLIKEGYLGRYVEKKKDRGERSQRRDEGGSKRCREGGHGESKDKEEVRGVVTTIVGGFCGGGETSSARKRYARQVMTIQTYLFEQGNNHPMITFTNEDFRGIQPHQDDPMVIDVLVAKARPRRRPPGKKAPTNRRAGRNADRRIARSENKSKFQVRWKLEERLGGVFKGQCRPVRMESRGHARHRPRSPLP
ncbi:hypothetical protein SESBI_26508 [Sesbania bispinosa]|nr:hypothetical protein SESBI_26508 [Sesbania bispinosa]